MWPLLISLACVNRVPTAPEVQARALAFGAHLGYVALGELGLATVDPASGAIGPPLPPPAPMDSVDDLALLNDVLVVLDAHSPGYVALYGVREDSPQLSAAPVEVPVGGVARVSNHHGVLVVSGGTEPLTVMTYDGYGVLGAARSQARVAEDQSEVLVDHTGERAYLSTRLDADRYGLTALQLRAPPAEPTVLSQLPIPGADGAALSGQIQDDLYYLGFSDGLAVVDVSDPAEMKILSLTALGVSGAAAAVELDRAYVVGSLPRPLLVELDVSEPAAPRVLEEIPLPEAAWPTDVAVRKGTVLVAAGPAGVLAFQRREPPDATRAQ